MKIKKISQIQICIFIVISWCMATDFLPLDGQSLNYTQIFFRWPQIAGSDSYEITIHHNMTSNTYSSQNNSIILDDFSWGEEYFWEACGLDEFNNSIYCYATYNFNINVLPLNYPNDVSVITYNESLSTPGITILDYESLNFSVALNITGEPIWFADKTNFPSSKIIVTEFSKNGNFIGYGSSGYEFNLDSEIIFQTPHNVHHSIVKSNNQTYFSIGGSQQTHPCPDPLLCGDSDMIWKGDSFTEVGSQGELLWEWDTFDYLLLDEYNSEWIGHPTSQHIDWTHSNSVFFDEMSNIVYVSMRNLTRITAIDYTTKEIIWNLGDSDFMDEESFAEDFGFSHQHSAQITNAGNLLFFDNGRANNPELSRCLEIEFDNNGDPELVWEYILPDSMLTLSRGECDRLLNGNALISAGRTGNVIEVDENNEIVWHLRAKINDNLDVNIYRSERVPNLYPHAYSFEVTNLKGSYPSYSIEDDSIDFTIYNSGWHSQTFIYELWSDSTLLDSGNLNIQNESQDEIQIDINNDNGSSYLLKVFTDNKPDSYQGISFIKALALGDLNSDSVIDILDIVIMVNVIMGQFENPGNADMNNDGVINVLDIVQLVNLILND